MERAAAILMSLAILTLVASQSVAAADPHPGSTVVVTPASDEGDPHCALGLDQGLCVRALPEASVTCTSDHNTYDCDVSVTAAGVGSGPSGVPGQVKLVGSWFEVFVCDGFSKICSPDVEQSVNAACTWLVPEAGCTATTSLTASVAGSYQGCFTVFGVVSNRAGIYPPGPAPGLVPVVSDRVLTIDSVSDGPACGSGG